MAEAQIDQGFWRSTLARALLGWMGCVLLFMLAQGRLQEVIPYLAFQVFILVVILAAPVLLFLPWCLSSLVRWPRSRWPGLVLLVLFCGAFVATFEQLLTAGAYLNFLTHRTAYEQIVADLQAGRLVVRRDESGCFTGVRAGVIFGSWDYCRGPAIGFPWSKDWPGTFTGVVYDPRGCPRPPPPPPEPPYAGPGEPPTLKNAGQLGQSWHLDGHYCFTTVSF